jgi:hypothetical protein
MPFTVSEVCGWAHQFCSTGRVAPGDEYADPYGIWCPGCGDGLSSLAPGDEPRKRALNQHEFWRPMGRVHTRVWATVTGGGVLVRVDPSFLSWGVEADEAEYARMYMTGP